MIGKREDMARHLTEEELVEPRQLVSLEDLLQRLLDPLDLAVERLASMSRLERQVAVVRKADKNSTFQRLRVVCESGSSFRHGYKIVFTDVEELVQYLMQTAKQFRVFTTDNEDEPDIDNIEALCVENPYFGYKSLEEALIRADLIGKQTA